MKRSTDHQVLESESINLMSELKPLTIHQLAANEMITECDFFDDCLMLYIQRVSEMKMIFTMIPDTLGSGEPGADPRV